MGRCYEFGPLVGENCEHAMVVPAGGGRCECGTCGASCTGRFAACTAILEQPGYVPSTAPAWAVAIGAHPSGPDQEPRVPEAASQISIERSREAHPPPTGGDLIELVEAVAKQLSEHDVDLVTRIDRLADQVADLQRQSEAQAAALEAAVAGLDALVTQLDESGRLAPPLGFPRRQP